jgi:tyrosine-protein kinase Etk/Wzc
MATDTQPNFLNEEENALNVRDVIEKYIRFWKWFVLGVILALGIAFIALRYSIPEYESSATILIKDDKDGGSGMGGMSLLTDLGIGGGGSNLENEIEILKSRTLIGQTVQNLKYNIVYTGLGKRTSLYQRELYLNSPIILTSVNGDSALYENNARFHITILDSIHFSLEEGSMKTIEKQIFGIPFNSSLGRMILSRSEEFSNDKFGLEYIIDIVSLKKATSKLQRKIQISRVNKISKVLTLEIQGPVIEQNNDILNELISLHEKSAIQDQNIIGKNTSEFINERMKFITEELDEVESQSENFKTKNQLVDVSSDAALYLSKESEIDEEITKANIQLSLAEYMNDYLKKPSSEAELLPSNIGIDDISIADLTVQYNQVMLDRNRLVSSSGPKNPSVIKIEAQLSSIRYSLSQSLKNLQSTLQIKLKALNHQDKIYQSKIASIPEYQREYRSIIRQQEIKETLYIYLLQKREENEITQAAAVTYTKVIDYAYSSALTVSPKKKIVYLGAFLLGLLVPFGFIYLRDLLDNKVHGKSDIESYGLPFLGDVPLTKVDEKIVINHPDDVNVSEAFRLVRTNLEFMLATTAKKNKTIFITSTVSKEGKSFISLNLATVFSLSKKKVLLIGLDLRAPKILQYLNLDNAKGVTHYLADENMSVDDIIYPFPNQPNLDLIPSGIIPPNPAEMLGHDRMDTMLGELQEIYDYIIVDTAPVALVTDTLLIAKHADAFVYVTRANTLDKRMLQIPAQLHKEKRLPNMAVLLNASDSKRGYGYGYGHGVNQETKKPWWKIWG